MRFDDKKASKSQPSQRTHQPTHRPNAPLTQALILIEVNRLCQQRLSALHAARGELTTRMAALAAAAQFPGGGALFGAHGNGRAAMTAVADALELNSREVLTIILAAWVVFPAVLAPVQFVKVGRAAVAGGGRVGGGLRRLGRMTGCWDGVMSDVVYACWSNSNQPNNRPTKPHNRPTNKLNDQPNILSSS